jgi:ribosome-associated protein
MILYCSTILTGAQDIQSPAPTWLVAVRAAESKKAADTQVLDLRGITSFADFFVIATGANPRQVQAISDEVGLQLKQQAGELPLSIEGYNQAEWVLADYGDLLVHIFSPKAREYYSLERLWRSAKTVEIPAE